MDEELIPMMTSGLDPWISETKTQRKVGVPKGESWFHNLIYGKRGLNKEGREE